MLSHVQLLGIILYLYIRRTIIPDFSAQKLMGTYYTQELYNIFFLVTCLTIFGIVGGCFMAYQPFLGSFNFELSYFDKSFKQLFSISTDFCLYTVK